MIEPRKKRCSGCKKKKLLRDFNTNASKKDGLQARCRICSARASRDYYKINGARMRQQIGEANKRRVHVVTVQVLRYLRRHPCVDCGEPDVMVLEFDHVRGVKSRNVAELVAQGCSWKTVQQEIRKCKVRCANCHRRRTRQLHVRYILSIEEAMRKTDA